MTLTMQRDSMSLKANIGMACLDIKFEQDSFSCKHTKEDPKRNKPAIVDSNFALGDDT